MITVKFGMKGISMERKIKENRFYIYFVFRKSLELDVELGLN